MPLCHKIPFNERCLLVNLQTMLQVLVYIPIGGKILIGHPCYSVVMNSNDTHMFSHMSEYVQYMAWVFYQTLAYLNCKSGAMESFIILGHGTVMYRIQDPLRVTGEK